MSGTSIVLVIISIVLVFVGLVGFIASIIALISPKIAKKKTRGEVFKEVMLPSIFFYLVGGGISALVDKDIEPLEVTTEIENKEEIKAIPESKKPVPKQLVKKEAIEKPTTKSKPNTKKNLKWYEEATLYKATISEWEKGNDRDRLATCGELVATMWSNNLLKDTIAIQLKSMKDTKVLAKELCIGLNEVATGESKDVISEQKVTETAAILATLMGWLK